MSSVIAILRDEQLVAEPGEEVSCTLSVHNTGTIVEQFGITVIGDAAGWSTVEPSVLSLFPNTQQDVTVSFRPPREWHVSPGVIPFGVSVTPANDPENLVTEEGTLEVTSFNDVQAELIPAVAMGKRKGKLGIAIDSRGNVALPAIVRGRDPSDTLVIRVKPRNLVLQPGTATFAKIRVIPRRRYLRGPQKQARFKVGVEPQDSEPILLDATLIQSALLPKGSFAGLAVLIGLAAWFLLIRPTVKDAAVNAIAPEVATQQKQTQSVSNQLKSTQKQVSQVSKKVTQVSTVSAHVAAAATSTTTSTTSTSTTTTTTASSSSTTTTVSGATTSTSATTSTTAPASTTTTTVPLGSGPQIPPGPYSNAIEVVAAPGQNQEQTFVIPQGDELQVTDVIIQNLNQENGSEVQFGIALPGGSPHYFFEMSLTQLTAEDFSLQTPIDLDQGYTIAISVSCAGAATAACAANVYFAGTVNVSSAS